MRPEAARDEASRTSWSLMTLQEHTTIGVPFPATVSIVEEVIARP
jgi:hypothetical protein